MSADAVVLLHGQPSTGAVWSAVRHHLDGHSGRTGPTRVLTPDRPGYGASPEPPTDFPGNVDWLMRYLDRVGVGRVVLAGHSWAGGIAVLAAARHPERVHALALVASVGPGCLTTLDRPLAWPVLGTAAAFVGVRAATTAQARRIRRYAAQDLPRPDRAHAEMALAAAARRPVWRSFLVEQRALIRQLSLVEDALAQVRAPTAVLTGTRDTVVPADCAERLAARLPTAHLRRIDGAGHELPLDEPDLLATTIRGLAA